MTLKPKANKDKPIHVIEVNNVFYIYAVGREWIAIATESNHLQWDRMLPDWCRVCFTVNSPIELPCRDDLKNMIRVAIRRKIHEQRKAYDRQAAASKLLAKREDQPGPETPMLNPDRKRREAVTPNLFE